MRKVLLVLVAVLSLSAMSAQEYKLKGFGGKINGFVFTDSTIASTKKGKIIEVTTGFRKKVKSESVTEYYRTDENGNKQRWQVVESSKKNVYIFITMIDSFTEEKTKATLRAKRLN